MVQKRGTTRRWWGGLALGAVAGYAGGRVMDVTTTAYMRRQSAASLQREKELQPEGTPTAMARRLAAFAGAEVTDQQARRIGKMLHRGSAVTGGCVVALASGTRQPLATGVVTAMALFVLVDEAAGALSGAAPSPREYPVETHIRGLVGHLAYGTAVGGVLQAARSLLQR